MGSYVTSTRLDPITNEAKLGWVYRGNSVHFSKPNQWSGGTFLATSDPAQSGYIAVPLQSTTSYRTGGGVPLVDASEENAFIDTPSTEAGTYDFLAHLRESDGTNISKWDNGHTFTTERHLIECSHPKVQLSSGGNTYVGPLICLPLKTGTKWIAGTSHSGLVSKYGPAAIAATAPTNPASTAGQGFYEVLADGLPAIPKIGMEATKSVWHTMRALAHGNLSIQFDWLPFVGDLQSTIHALLNASRLTRQYMRDSGRVVRRSIDFPAITTTTDQGINSSISASAALCSPPGVDTSKGWALPSAPNQSWYMFHTGAGSAVAETLVVTTKVWFKGAYSYFVPTDHGRYKALLDFEEKANHLLGTRLTPSLLWQLAPWSWLLDWKSQIGNSIKNFTALQTDSLVIRYGYLMIQTNYRHEVTLRNLYTRYDTAPRDPITCSTSYITVRKERYRATPYGFGVDLSGLTARQWSILGSLGMTRSSNTLRVDS